jgi:hypothetical protein
MPVTNISRPSRADDSDDNLLITKTDGQPQVPEPKKRVQREGREVHRLLTSDPSPPWTEVKPRLVPPGKTN